MRRSQGAGSKVTRVDPGLGDAPRLATSQDLLGANPPMTGRTEAKRAAARMKGGAGLGKINLKSVAEACIAAGLDPAEAIATALTTKTQATDRMGTPLFDANGEPMMVDAVDPDTRLRTLQELLQYTQPKLKAVEVKMSGALELTSEQLDQRLASLLAKAGAGR